MQVHCDEGAAVHIGPEPCVVVREGRGEASAGDRIGQPLSRESISPRGPTPCVERKATRTGALMRAPVHPARSETLACADASCSGTGRSHRRPRVRRRRGRIARGPHREGEEPKPVMHGDGKSDPAIAATKPANQAGRPVAELVEPRAGLRFVEHRIGDPRIIRSSICGPNAGDGRKPAATWLSCVMRTILLPASSTRPMLIGFWMRCARGLRSLR